MIHRNIDNTERLVFYQMREDYIRVNSQNRHSDIPYFDIYYPSKEFPIGKENEDKFCVVEIGGENYHYFNILDECIIYVFKVFNEYLQKIEYFTKESKENEI